MVIRLDMLSQPRWDHDVFLLDDEMIQLSILLN